MMTFLGVARPFVGVPGRPACACVAAGAATWGRGSTPWVRRDRGTTPWPPAHRRLACPGPRPARRWALQDPGVAGQIGAPGFLISRSPLAARRSTRRPGGAGGGEGMRNSMAGRFVSSGRAGTRVGLRGNTLENQGAAPKLLAVTGRLSPVSVIIRR